MYIHPIIITKSSRAGMLMLTVFLLTMMLAASSCKKFLSTYSQNETYIKTASDLQELMAGEAYARGGMPVWVNLMDDDLENNAATIYNSPPIPKFSNIHLWQPNVFQTGEGKIYADVWCINQYRKIAVLNTILLNIPLVKGDDASPENLRRIAGEAHFLRALAYFNLANVFGKPYRVSTAASDYSIPLKTDPAVTDKFLTRATTKEMFDQLVADLLDSERELAGVVQSTKARASQAAAQALLSRVYLFMGKYEESIDMANKALAQRGYSIIDLNAPLDGPFQSKSSPETIFCVPMDGSGSVTSLISITYTAYTAPFVAVGDDNYKVSPDLQNAYEPNDLRLGDVFYQKTKYAEWLPRKVGMRPTTYEETCIRLPELLLNKAEALAILGRGNEAAETIQELRKKRFRPDQLPAVTATGADLVAMIRNERRRELSLEGHRWFDLRRYAVNAEFPFNKTIRHISYAYNNTGRYVNGYCELKPYAQDQAAYVIPFPESEIEFNQGNIVNEKRPLRPLQ